MADNGENGRRSTRAYKKISPNGRMTVYLGKRYFIDHGTHTDPVEGAIMIDSEYMKNRKIYIDVLYVTQAEKAMFDITSDDCIEKCIYSQQIYPRGEENVFPLTRLQQRVVSKYGPDAIPFSFSLPSHNPQNVTVESPANESEKACGLEYILRFAAVKSSQSKFKKKNTVCLAIRKIVYVSDS